MECDLSLLRRQKEKKMRPNRELLGGDANTHHASREGSTKKRHAEDSTDLYGQSTVHLP